MIKTMTYDKAYEQTIAKQCDRCKKEYNNPMEMQEFHHIRFTGGYESRFGDGTNVECDLCQNCLLLLIEKYMRTSDRYPEEAIGTMDPVNSV